MSRFDTGALHPHYPKPNSKQTQKGPTPHGFHGNLLEKNTTRIPKAKERIPADEQREDLMPNPDRKFRTFPREWPDETGKPTKKKKALFTKKTKPKGEETVAPKAKETKRKPAKAKKKAVKAKRKKVKKVAAKRKTTKVKKATTKRKPTSKRKSTSKR